MALARPVQPITANDDEIRDALQYADLPALLPALALVTGDFSLLRDDLRIDPTLMMEEQGGLTEEQQAAIRQVALDALVGFRDGGACAAPPPTHDDLDRILEFLAGGLPSADYLPMMRRGAGPHGDLRAAALAQGGLAADRPFLVAIVGAGMSGIIAAYRLEQAGVPYIVFDKNADVGGTWLENTYPGCRVDIPNHYYSYSFAQRDDWPFFYSPQAELHRYFRQCVDEFGIRDHIRFGTEVSSIVCDEGAGDVDAGAASAPDGERADAHGQRRDQRGRPAQPAAVPEHRGPRQLRRAVVPLAPSGTTASTSPASGSA